MDAGHTDVEQPIHVVAHDLRRYRSLFGHRYVRSSRRRDQDDTPSSWDFHASFDDPGARVKPRIRHDFGYFREGRVVGPRHEQAMAAADDGRGDLRDLVGGFSLAEDDLRKALPGRSRVIDTGEAQVFHGRAHDRCHGGPFRVGGRQLTALDRVEERAKWARRSLGCQIEFGHGGSGMT
jgi:hypothetical protein